jgi:DNA (cytosine-5)-methyltransferase 1
VQLQLGDDAERQNLPVESFQLRGGTIVRSVLRRDGSLHESEVAAADIPKARYGDEALAALFERAWLRSRGWPPTAEKAGSEVRVVDLFSGCGGLTLGAWEAARALGKTLVPVLAVDTDRDALAVYACNFPADHLAPHSIEADLDGDLGESLTLAERRLKGKLKHIDLLLAGPPCQGHSDLNNHTRREDPKNTLYLRVARFAEVVRPTSLLIENVPGVVHDTSNVVGQTWDVLGRLGYFVQGAVLNAVDFGVPQRRRRYFTVASLEPVDDLADILERYRRFERPVLWACDDLEEVTSESIFDSSATHSSENKRRIRYLFESDLYELPDSERPDCHRLKRHSYKSVYGRMLPNLPAPTITAGFGSTGQGRFVHPRRQRTLTPHEAARVQFFPDFFEFGDRGRGAYQQMIGNAVPSKLAYVLTLELLR